MLPAPRKPTPVTIDAAMRVGSTRVPKAGSNPSVVNRHDPAPMSAMVRIPAGWPCISRSVPRASPSKRATTMRRPRSASPVKGRGLAPARATAGFVLGLGFVRELGQVKAVDEVAEHRQPLIVDGRLGFFFVV